MKSRIIIALTALFLFSSQIYADLIVIGDVDAPTTSSRPQNYPLLENIRNGGTDIVWLTGGYPVNFRYTDLRSRWTTAGATITDDTTVSAGTSLAGRDLVVVSQLWSNVSQFDTAATSSISNYLANGGIVLYIAQVSSTITHLPSYNTFLTDIGSSMQFLASGGDTSGTEVIDTATPYGSGVTAFELGGWTAISGGIPVVTLNGFTGVAYESISATARAIPTVSVWGLAILISAFGLLGFRRRVR